jgi:hypothetical protein
MKNLGSYGRTPLNSECARAAAELVRKLSLSDAALFTQALMNFPGDVSWNLQLIDRAVNRGEMDLFREGMHWYIDRAEGRPVRPRSQVELFSGGSARMF